MIVPFRPGVAPFKAHAARHDAPCVATAGARAGDPTVRRSTVPCPAPAKGRRGAEGEDVHRRAGAGDYAAGRRGPEEPEPRALVAEARELVGGTASLQREERRPHRPVGGHPAAVSGSGSRDGADRGHHGPAARRDVEDPRPPARAGRPAFVSRSERITRRS